jgi:protease I
VDREVVEDRNWVSSRQPYELPAFNRAMIQLFSRSLASSHP